MIVTLIGYRGSGKSTVAPILARLLDCDWVDADVEIERQAGRTIREIFAAEGEPGFRRREFDVICELLKGDCLVLAAGGGAILNPETRQRMRRAGPVVWLEAPLETLAARIAGDQTTADRRPNLAGGGREEIARMLSSREPMYRDCATVRIDATDRPPEELAAEIHARIASGESA